MTISDLYIKLFGKGAIQDGDVISMAEHGRFGNVSTGTGYKATAQFSIDGQLLDYVGTTNPIYLGLAVPGSATSAAVWQIRKLTWDGNNNPTAIQYAGGTPEFNQIWDNRTSLSYS